MDDIDEKENRGSKDRSPSPAIKSTAVVKYTAVQSPAGYARLQCNTDLNLPPSNWSSAIDSYGLKQILTQNPGLSSFRMAHMFPDSVGEVDVISGAECIKNLLKLPYSPNGTVSMIVHRIENTLLLDDFDIYEYLMKSEWAWLKDFFYENILKTMSEQEQLSLLRKQGSGALQLTSKFLCHSIVNYPELLKEVDNKPASTPMLKGPFLPEPEDRSRSSHDEHLYNRNVLWTFENIQMLIGSDLPIFGGKDRPCVSLKLRDAREPINVLTGIDYWLDNLMCNVPEVLMCYHIDGFVQKYEPMKTEELPTLDGSRFSPKVIRNVAQNILAFLKANATKSGHTYWLFKGPHDDVVKLYDLTSLCGGNEGVDNPFTTPVAMLLYRVARNMRLTNRSAHVRALLENCIKLLSERRYPQIVASSHYMLADLYVPATTNPACPDFKDQCVDEEESEENSEACREEAFTSTSEREGDSETLASEGDGNQLALQMRGLALNDLGKLLQSSSYQEQKDEPVKPSTGLGTDPPSRCGKALEHSLRGLQALHHVTITKCQEEERERLKQQIIKEELNPKMANPFEPIRMQYEPLAKADTKEHVSRNRRRKRDKKPIQTPTDTEPEPQTNLNIDKNAILIRKENKIYPSYNEPSRDDNFAWKLHLKTLLYEKLCLAFATLAEFSYTNEQFGFSLKYIDFASKCQKLLSNMIIKSLVVDASCLLGRVGDNYFQFSKHWSGVSNYKQQFTKDHETDRLLRLEIENDINEEMGDVKCGTDQFNLDIILPESETQAMVLSCEYYKRAISVTDSEKRNELLRRLGSVNNELGVKYMNDAQAQFVKYSELGQTNDSMTSEMKGILKQLYDLSTKAAKSLEEAAHIFQQVNDVPNLALLYCNKARYLRFKALCDPHNSSFNAERRCLYNQAEELYLGALKILGNKEKCSSIWELVSWELSCHTYTKATLVQDRLLSYVNEANEAAEALRHALKYCNLSPGSRQYVYQFRAAMLYYKLGSLYHKQYRDTREDGTRRRLLFSQARSNYDQAAMLFALIEETNMFLTVQLEHVAALEMQALNSSNLKLKSLQTALLYIRQCHSIIKYMKNRDPEDIRDTKPDDQQEEFKSEFSLLSLLENRLHHTLKNIIQYCRTKQNKDYEKMTEMYKKIYCASLKIKKNEDVQLFAASFSDVLESIDAIAQDFE